MSRVLHREVGELLRRGDERVRAPFRARKRFVELMQEDPDAPGRPTRTEH
jgi:hypothetical protein